VTFAKFVFADTEAVNADPTFEIVAVGA